MIRLSSTECYITFFTQDQAGGGVEPKDEASDKVPVVAQHNSSYTLEL